MKIIVKISLMLLSPVMVVMYLRNSFRTIDNLHANFELNYAE